MLPYVAAALLGNFCSAKLVDGAYMNSNSCIRKVAHLTLAAAASAARNSCVIPRLIVPVACLPSGDERFEVGVQPEKCLENDLKITQAASCNGQG